MPNQTPTSDRTILNVNDDEPSRYVISRMLERAGFRVVEASTAREAFELVVPNPALVLLDVGLPDLDGVEVCRRLKANPSTASVPIVHLTALSVGSSDRVRGLAGGADGYLGFPLEERDLVATIESVLRARRGEADARAEVRQWQSTFDALSDAVVLVDADGCISRANRRAREIFGSDETLLGKPHEIVAPDLVCANARPSFETVAATREQVVGLVRYHGRRMRVTVDPVVGPGGEFEGAVYIFADDRSADEAERRHLELELEARLAELADADRRKDEFLAMLGHELRNPLGALALSLHLMERQGSRDEKTAKARATCVRQVQHLTRMVDDLLDVSRITRGKVELRTQSIELGAAVQNAVAGARSGNHARHEVRIELPPDAVWLEADPTRLEQIITNLVSNAFKYTPAPGHIEISVGTEGDGSTAVLRVKDDGKGIPKGMQSRIFDLFVQVEQSQDRHNRGLGIGLTMVKRLVDMHGGSVECRSEGPGRGSEFIVRLPALVAKAACERDVDPGLEDTVEGFRILVVEDNEDVRESLRELIEQWGHRIEVAADGKTALAALERFQPDVAIVDIGLPGMDGYQVAAAMRATAVGTRAHLIALTGYGRQEDQDKAMAAGFDMHLVKPIKAEALALVLKQFEHDAYDAIPVDETTPELVVPATIPFRVRS